jgi:hypothetical protein
MAADRDGIHVDMSTFLGVAGGVMAAEKGDIDLRSRGGMSLAAVAERSRQGDNYQDRKIGGAFYATDGAVRATAAGDQTRRGITVEAAKAIGLQAGGVRSDEALALHSHSVIKQTGGETVTHRVDQAVSTYRTAGHFSDKGPGTLDRQAPRVEAKSAHLQGSTITDHEVHDTVQTTTTTKESGGLLGGSTTVREERLEGKSKGAVFETETSPVYEATQGNAVLTNVTSRQKIHFIVPHGIVQLLAGRNFYFYARTEESSGTLMRSVVHDSGAGTTYTPCHLPAGAKIQARDGVLVESVKGKTLEWLALLDAGDSQVIQRALEEEHRTHHFEQEGPTMALAAVISLAVTVATYGTGAAAAVGGGLASSVGCRGDRYDCYGSI